MMVIIVENFSPVVSSHEVALAVAHRFVDVLRPLIKSHSICTNHRVVLVSHREKCFQVDIVADVKEAIHKEVNLSNLILFLK